MKKVMIILVAICLIAPMKLFSQDKRAIKAAELSFSAAENDTKKSNFQEAAQKFEIVVSSIPEGVDSRKHLVMRLESLINLVDIYFYKTVNIEKACLNMNLYFANMNKIRNSGILKGKELLNYLEQEKEFSKQQSQCESYNRIGSDMEKFRKKFDEEMKEE
jgi:hypothetical protein